MNKVRPWLFIGSYRDALDLEYLEQNSIQAMLQLAEKRDIPGIVSLHLSIEDFQPIPPEKIERGVRFILEQKSFGRPILVSCGAGVNRSSAYCIAALKESEGLGLLAAYQEVLKAHTEALPNHLVWLSLCEYYNDHTHYLNVLRLAAK